MDKEKIYVFWFYEDDEEPDISLYEKVCKDLRNKGYVIVQDFEFDFQEIEGRKHKFLYYTSQIIALVADQADTVYFMKDWNHSKIGNILYECCIEFGIPIIVEN